MINDSQFIDLIEQNPVIWNRKSKEFRNLSHRLETWEKVSLICGTNSAIVQKRWKSLREKYVRERKYWQNICNRPGIKVVKQRWELCNKMHFIAPYCTPRANNSPKQGSGADLDDFDDNVDLSFDLNPPQSQQIKDEINETVDNTLQEENEFTYNCSPTSTMMPGAGTTDTDASSLTNRTAQVISSTTNQHQSEPSPVASDDDYAESSESETEEPRNAEEPHLPIIQPTQQMVDDSQPDDRKRKFSVFGKFVCEELISLESDEAELLYTRILSEVLNFRVRKQMRSSL